jgi:hypothetical protein
MVSDRRAWRYPRNFRKRKKLRNSLPMRWPKAILIWEEVMPTLVGFGTFAALAEERISDKISRRILSGDQGMIVWWSIGAGVHVEPHSHANEQIVWMLKGKMEFGGALLQESSPTHASPKLASLSGFVRRYDSGTSLKSLTERDLSPDDLVIIPGNHDIQWTTSAVASDRDRGWPARPPPLYRAALSRLPPPPS